MNAVEKVKELLNEYGCTVDIETYAGKMWSREESLPTIYHMTSETGKQPTQYLNDISMLCREAYTRLQNTHLHLYVRRIYKYIAETVKMEEVKRLDLSLAYSELGKLHELSAIKPTVTPTNGGMVEYLFPKENRYAQEYFIFESKNKKKQYGLFYKLLLHTVEKARDAMTHAQYSKVKEALECITELHETNSFLSCLYVPAECSILNGILNNYGLYIDQKDIYNVDFNNKAKKGLWTFLAV